MNTCHGAACWRARAYLKLREDGHTDTTYANDVLSADMTRRELVEALEQLPLKAPSSTRLLVIDRGVARYLVDALPPDFSSKRNYFVVCQIECEVRRNKTSDLDQTKEQAIGQPESIVQLQAYFATHEADKTY